MVIVLGLRRTCRRFCGFRCEAIAAFVLVLLKREQDSRTPKYLGHGDEGMAVEGWHGVVEDVVGIGVVAALLALLAIVEGALPC